MARLIVANGRKIDEFGADAGLSPIFGIHSRQELVTGATANEGLMLAAVCFSISSSRRYCDKAPVGSASADRRWRSSVLVSQRPVQG